MMNYRQIRPSAATAEFVECYWILEDDSPSATDVERQVQRIVPDGCPELILNLRHPFESERDGHWNSQPEYFFVGQITGPMMVRPGGPAKVLGVRFRPHGAGRVLRIPLHELTGLAVPLADLSPALFRELACLPELGSTARQVAYVDGVLRVFAAQEENGLVACAVNRLMRSDGETDVADLATDLGLSSRQLQRRFKAEVGVSPKLFGRMQRFQRVFHALDFPSANWVNIAVQCGYYDQAHLIRDFRDFSGEAPAALLSAETDLAFHFLQNQSLQNRSMSHFSKTAALAAT